MACNNKKNGGLANRVNLTSGSLSNERLYVHMSRTMKIGLLICCLICRPRLICVVLTDPLKQI